MNIQAGTLSDFFESARETAKELDRGERLTPKHRVWVDPEDFSRLIKPERVELIRHLRGKKHIVFNELVKDMHRSAKSLRRDVNLLAKYQLVSIERDYQNGHGGRLIISPLFGMQKLEVKAEI